jgi:glucose-1-phosphate cytidylyltransferase
MKAVILAGGLGTRIAEETSVRPKPMVEIGGRPILWHIMKMYSAHGINDFVICLGYKGYVIKEFFANYFLHCSDVTIHLSENRIETHKASSEPWKVTLVETGDSTMTGGRLKRVKEYLGNERFCFTYGDGLADIDLGALLNTHKNSRKLATVTAVQPPGRFGTLHCQDGAVERFDEKPLGDGHWINGGFFVLEPETISTIEDDTTIWEKGPLESLAARGQLSAYFHTGFWQPMDTLRDKQKLEEMWSSGEAPWKVW